MCLQEIITDDVESRAEELYDGVRVKLLNDLQETVAISSREVEEELQEVAKRVWFISLISCVSSRLMYTLDGENDVGALGRRGAERQQCKALPKGA